MRACAVEIDPDLAAKVAEMERIWVGRGLDRPAVGGRDGKNGRNGMDDGQDEVAELRLGVGDYQRRQGWLRRWEAEREEIFVSEINQSKAQL